MQSLLHSIAGSLAWSTAPVDYAPLALTILAVLALAVLYFKLYRPQHRRPPE